MIFNFLSFCVDCMSYAGILARVAEVAAEPHAPAASDSDFDQSMDSDEARDFADQFPDLDDDPDSPASCGNNDQNRHILAAILKSIPECINETDFERLADLIPHQEPVHVATRTVQEAIVVSSDIIKITISYTIS